MATEQQFNDAASAVKNLKTSPDNTELLELYSLYKQGTVGDCNTDRPGMLAMKEKAKWDAWNGRKGMAKDEAQRKYTEKANSLIQKYQ